MPALLVALVLVATAGCSSHPQFFRADRSKLEDPAALAVMPLLNLSRYDQAEVLVMNTLIIELLDSELFEVLDPGLVETVILEKRLRFTDRLPLDTMTELGERLSVHYLLLGSVNEFDFISDRNDKLPSVSISLRIVECNSGRIIWAATHSRRGDDEETVFGLGRVETLEQLAAVTVKEMTRTLRP